ncbi:hypothetical protein [Variovorax sp. Root473]|uniref:hypothetical protein n=1 Tax=Variovorax sp. Root473 TaxID=1736541 RepID=UPI0007015A79|nr:hypothetical protein [Variovorax sp. Root473]KQX90564.1 hypothetical protein ASD34_04775 [Variovorax sp. Root473]
MTSTSPKIACLGWGSLCWQPKELRTAGGWQLDGPMLPLEFTRTSDEGKGRLTLVVTPGVPEVQSLWVLLDYESLEDAREALMVREGCLPGGVGVWPGPDEHKRLGGGTIAAWARNKGFDHVLWTALGPKFMNENGRQPTSAREAVDYLRSRPPAVFAQAEEYVRKAPLQVRTTFRTAFEERLGWTPHQPPL